MKIFTGLLTVRGIVGSTGDPLGDNMRWPSPITGNPEWGSPKTVARSQYVLN